MYIFYEFVLQTYCLKCCTHLLVKRLGPNKFKDLIIPLFKLKNECCQWL